MRSSSPSRKKANSDSPPTRIVQHPRGLGYRKRGASGTRTQARHRIRFADRRFTRRLTRADTLPISNPNPKSSPNVPQSRIDPDLSTDNFVSGFCANATYYVNERLDPDAIALGNSRASQQKCKHTAEALPHPKSQEADFRRFPTVQQLLERPQAVTPESQSGPPREC